MKKRSWALTKCGISTDAEMKPEESYARGCRQTVERKNQIERPGNKKGEGGVADKKPKREQFALEECLEASGRRTVNMGFNKSQTEKGHSDPRHQVVTIRERRLDRS